MNDVTMGSTILRSPSDNISRDNTQIVNYTHFTNNMIISGREHNGYPAFLMGVTDLIDMRHEVNTHISNIGIVSSDSKYDDNHMATNPLTNQAGRTRNSWWCTHGAAKGWWQYEFKRPRILRGLYYCVPENCRNMSWKKWQLLGKNTSGTWDIVYSRTNDQPLTGHAHDGFGRGRYYWFDNTTAYTIYRINIDENHGAAYTGFVTIRFYECQEPLIASMHRYDTALFASESKPFACNVSIGLNDDKMPTPGKICRIVEPVIFDGRKLPECTMNQFYVVTNKSIDNSGGGGISK